MHSCRRGRAGGAERRRGQEDLAASAQPHGRPDGPVSDSVLGEVEDWTGVTDLADTSGKSKIAPGDDNTRVEPFVHGSKNLFGASNEDMAKMYQAADVLPTATCAENFGVPVVEAHS